MRSIECRWSNGKGTQPDTEGSGFGSQSVLKQHNVTENDEEQVKPDVFHPPHHKLTTNIQNELDALLKEYELQFMKDRTSIGTTPLTSMTIDTGNSDPVSQKPYPIAMKHYQWVKEEKEKILTAKVICSSRSSWSAPIIIVPKGDGGKPLVIDYRTLNKVT